MSEISQEEITKRRLRWKCRRGMLELDLYLMKFFDKHYDELNDQQKQAFARFLEVEDTQLWAWFLKMEEPEDPEFKELVEVITE